MLRGSRVLIAGLLLTAAACSRRQANTDSTQPRAAIRVFVTNNWELSMEVYVRGSGANHRLGLVAPGASREFILPMALVGNGPIQFLAQTSGDNRTVTTTELVLGPGDIVDFEITTQLLDSRATVRIHPA